MGVLQRWGGGLSRRKRAALAAQEEAAPRVVEMPAVTPVQPVMYNISDFLSPSLPPR